MTMPMAMTTTIKMMRMRMRMRMRMKTSLASTTSTTIKFQQQQQQQQQQQGLQGSGLGLRMTQNTRFMSSSSSSSSNIDKPKTVFEWNNQTFDLSSEECNIPNHIAERALEDSSLKLYKRVSHPLHTIQQQIYNYFGPSFTKVDSLSPIVSTTSNFDSLLIPIDHVSRSKSDTYYLNDTTCLRTHTSAHQVELLHEHQLTQFLCTGDVYRRDDIDKSHYPIFHQMEGVKVFPLYDETTGQQIDSDYVLKDLQTTLQGLANHLFGNDIECRWVEEYFPFTHPSLELEIKYINDSNNNNNNDNNDDNDWLEVLGCGVMRPEIHKLPDGRQAWAFGLGLERLAMILFDIPDIRLFWSKDDRFWNQFQPNTVTKFQPYSKYPPCFKDVSFWILNHNNNDSNKEGEKSSSTKSYDTQDFLDLTRQVAGDIVENVQLIDEFVHPKTKLQSKCFRITYRSMDRSLTNAEIDVLQEELRQRMEQELPIELR